MRNDWKLLQNEIEKGNIEAAKWFSEVISSDNLTIYDYQMANLCFLAKIGIDDGVLLADNVGLGKTISSLLGMMYHILFNRARTVLLLVPPKLIDSKWKKELNLFFNTPKAKFRDTSYSIPLFQIIDEGEIYPDIFDQKDDQAKIVVTSPYRIREHLECNTICNDRCRMTRVLLGTEIDLLIVDEIHVFSPNDASTKKTLENERSSIINTGLSRSIERISRRSIRRIFLSATPMGNSTLELFGILRLIHDDYRNITAFCYQESKAKELSHLTKIIEPKLVQAVSDLSFLVLRFLENRRKREEIYQYQSVKDELLAIGKINPEKSVIDMPSKYEVKWGLFTRFLLDIEKTEEKTLLKVLDAILEFGENFHPKYEEILSDNKAIVKMIGTTLDLRTRFRQNIARTLLDDVPSIKRVKRKINLITVDEDNEETQEINRINNQLEEIIQKSRENFTQEKLKYISISINAKKRLASEIYSYWLTAKRSEMDISKTDLMELIMAQRNSDEEGELAAGGIVPKFKFQQINEEISEGENTLVQFPIDSMKYLKLKDVLDNYFERRNLPVIIFTEYEDTLRYVADRMERDYPSEKVLRYSGGKYRTHEIYDFSGLLDLFRKNPLDVPRLIISTDAGSTGIDLPFCGMVINYDIPWNPVKLIQRIGRLDRVNRTEVIEEAVLTTQNDRSDRRIKPNTDLEGINLFNGMRGSADYRIVKRQVKKIKQHWTSLGSIDTVLMENEEMVDLERYQQEVMTQRELDIEKLKEQGIIPGDFGIKSASIYYTLRDDFVYPQIPPEADNLGRFRALSVGIENFIHDNWPAFDIILNTHEFSPISFAQLSEKLVRLHRNNSGFFYHMQSLVTTILGLPSTEQHYSDNLPHFIGDNRVRGIRNYLEEQLYKNKVMGKSEKKILEALRDIIDLFNQIPMKKAVILDIIRMNPKIPLLFIVKNHTSMICMDQMISAMDRPDIYCLTWDQYDARISDERDLRIYFVGLPFLDYHHASKLIKSHEGKLNLVLFDLELQILKRWLAKYDNYINSLKFKCQQSYQVDLNNNEDLIPEKTDFMDRFADLLIDNRDGYRYRKIKGNPPYERSVLIEFETGERIIVSKNSRLYRPLDMNNINLGSTVSVTELQLGDVICFSKNDTKREIFEEILSHLYTKIPEIEYLDLLPKTINETIRTQKYDISTFRRDLNKNGMNISTDATIEKWKTGETKFPINREKLVQSLSSLTDYEKWHDKKDDWLIAISRIQGLHSGLSQIITKKAINNYENVRNNYMQISDEIPITYAELFSIIQIARISHIDIIEEDKMLEGLYIK